MGAEKEKRPALMMPVFTLSVMTGAIVSYLSADVSACLVYDRQAILNGEFWRLLTSHLVHFNLPHLVFDLSAFGLAGWVIEMRGCRHFGWLCIAMGACISLFLMLMKTEIAFYGGLSGPACGAFVYLALCGLQDSRPWGFISRMVLFMIALKIVIEALQGEFFLKSMAAASVEPIWEAHAIGSAVALSAFALQKGLDRKALRSSTGP